MAYNEETYIQPWCYNRSISPDGNPEENEIETSEKKNKKEYMKTWRENNKDKIRESRKIWEEKNKDRLRESKKQWRENNKDKIKEYHNEWRENNKVKIKEYKEKFNLKINLEIEVKKTDEALENLKMQMDEISKELEKLEERKACCLKLLE